MSQPLNKQDYQHILYLVEEMRNHPQPPHMRERSYELGEKVKFLLPTAPTPYCTCPIPIINTMFTTPHCDRCYGIIKLKTPRYAASNSKHGKTNTNPS